MSGDTSKDMRGIVEGVTLVDAILACRELADYRLAHRGQCRALSPPGSACRGRSS